MSNGRKYYTKAEWDAQLAVQGGLCATWGCTSSGPFDADHEIPNAWEPGKPTQLLCKPCHKIKTRADKKRIAKAERQAGRKGQVARRKKNGPQMKSRGFDKTKTKRMDGSVVARSKLS